MSSIGRWRKTAIVWDDEDSSTDLYVRAAYSVARALSAREYDQSSLTQHTILTLDQAIRAVEKQIQHLDQIKTWSETIRGHGEKICDRTIKMKVELAKEIERFDEVLGTLHRPTQPGGIPLLSHHLLPSS